jgi:putative PIN family toxin of toxin-antitoxin system
VIRAVIDTNILVSALIKPQGRVGPVLLYLREGRYILIYSEPILEELVEVLSRPMMRRKYHLTEEDIEAVLLLISLRGRPVSPTRRIRVCRDPRDNKFLEAAVAGNADLIVSGDEDLLILSPFEGIPSGRPSS